MNLSLNDRKNLVEISNFDISVKRQCELLGLNRSSLYYKSSSDISDLSLKNCIDEIYTESPFYGSRRIAFIAAERLEIAVNRKKVQRIMQEMSIVGIHPQKNTSKSEPGHKIYPYLLRGFRPTKPLEVWSTDITYIRLDKGFCYLSAVIDWYSRYVLSWRLSNTMDSYFCQEVLEESLLQGTPKVFNTDQGSQFTCEDFTSILLKNGIKISMDGRGRALDNIFVERLWRTVKYENIFLRGYATLQEAKSGLDAYFKFYNCERPHASLGYLRPKDVHLGLCPQTVLH